MNKKRHENNIYSVKIENGDCWKIIIYSWYTCMCLFIQIFAWKYKFFCKQEVIHLRTGATSRCMKNSHPTSWLPRFYSDFLNLNKTCEHNFKVSHVGSANILVVFYQKKLARVLFLLLYLVLVPFWPILVLPILVYLRIESIE